MLKFTSKILFVLLFFNASVLTAHPGPGIVMDSHGNVFYTDLAHVWKITPDGKLTIAIKDVHTHELYLDRDDNLYGEHVWYNGEATDTWGYYVWCLSTIGELQQTVPPTEGFPLNNTLVRDSKGSMYYAEKSGDHEVLMKETINGVISLVTAHEFKDIRWIYYSEYEEHLYISDYLELKKVSLDGKVELLADGIRESGPPFAGVADHHYVMGMWSDPEQQVYVALYGAKKVKKINENGSLETVYQSPPYWSPCGGLIDTDRSLWIMEFSNKNKTRVKKISEDGTEIIFKS